MSNHHAGLGKQWINGPGFVRWLEEIRPLEMAKPTNSHDVGGKSAWATDSDVRALFRAEHESGTISLKVADRLCVKLDIHIDTEMPEELWTDDPKVGKKHRSPKQVKQLRQQAIPMIEAGHTPKQIAEALGVTDRSARNWIKEHQQQDGWLAGLIEHTTMPKTWVRETA
jgi:hypothetical protein